jgi:hypothetical protein
MELEGSLPCLQKYDTGTYPKLDESSLHPHALFLEDPFNSIFLQSPDFLNNILRLGFPSKMYTFLFSPKCATRISSLS